MTVILRRNDEDTALEPVSETNPLHVALPDGAVVTSHVYRSETIEIPGIGAAVAYASGDAFGTKFSINVPNEGTIATLVFIDRDDEGITKEFILFDAEFRPPPIIQPSQYRIPTWRDVSGISLLTLPTSRTLRLIRYVWHRLL